MHAYAFPYNLIEQYKKQWIEKKKKKNSMSSAIVILLCPKRKEIFRLDDLNDH